MREFDAQLLRLKQALGVTEDQDVATALALTKAAFSDRKRRGAFPEDKLFALQARRPELGIDATYVLTGERLSASERVKADNMHRLVAQFPGLNDAEREQLAANVAASTQKHVDAVKRKKIKLAELEELLVTDEDDRLLDLIIQLVKTASLMDKSR